MTDHSGGTPPYTIPGFPGFGQADMMGKMWELMRLNPFAAAMPGGGQGVGPSLSMMSDMLAPLTNIEELDKRVTDMRAVEQWLKLNLNMLQSAIQALEVQRATLATLRAFGAYAQTSVESAQQAAEQSRGAAAGWPMGGASAAKPEARAQQEAAPQAPADVAEPQDREPAAPPPGFDPSGWWNVLQSQFNQLAHLAMLQPGMTPPPGAAGAGEPPAAEAGAQASADDEQTPSAAAAKKAPPRKTPPRKKPA
ncbi:PhaM family polyhydroxyalkanoate granule multifunctional regulatory protein [Caballeronia sp. LZ034LL]|uniref:PhaM family polyhydroxyalkanoate granule multifunctional regulatory protein n=1 Tax=Caballeronia sp. LZ034LL TaxID=3038567 RepID=UPI002866231E|nr:PhaM family polyhydroxyalkanoate granule multifunctional regulatory protein [Caballeronia sp. LZ034LL]MDR5832704.1 alginate biosynthesis protein AlgP [Caballeronia sp. LZ034LL]